MNKLFIVAGEASGDLHGAKLVDALKRLHPDLIIKGWGGHLMEQAGALVTKHYRDLAFMGFVEVVKNLPAIRKNFAQCKAEIQAFQPDAIVFIDYPGFNLRLCKWTYGKGYTNLYYISPQVWAWKSNRVKTIRKYIHQLYTILPFEKKWYHDRDVQVDYVGHPLLERIPAPERILDSQNKPKGILLPGSRKQEVEKLLPIMLEATQSMTSFEWSVAGTSQLDQGLYLKTLKSFPHATLVLDRTYDLLSESSIAAVASGTATLETALFKVPQVVCFRANALSVWIARRLIKVKYISLVNLILDRPAITELIQSECNPVRLKKALNKAYEFREDTQADYDYLRELLQVNLPASQVVANSILTNY